MVWGKRGGLLCRREHAIHVFTSRPQKHSRQWNYSPPGMKEVRFYGTRVSQNTTPRAAKGAARGGGSQLLRYCGAAESRTQRKENMYVLKSHLELT